MAIKTAATPFPIFPPNLAAAPPRRPVTEIRFSRWNNANAQPFLRRQREQQEIEDDLRRHRQYESATRIAEDCEGAAAGPVEFKSRGTPSAPSSPSIPGKASKYSKPPREAIRPRNPDSAAASHPAFRRVDRVRRGAAKLPAETERQPGITMGENGVSYKFENAPFEFQYSYTETPKVKPLALREPPFLPFGPSTMPRPWTGRAPLPPSKKRLPEFDSFKLPPPGKKGVKPVQAPGPFLAGSGPKYHTASREEILGEPLTEEEVKDLIRGCLKTKRQLNMGRDGLTHNMLENIHAHWKRRRVCKIKCKGVCTVDMDNVRQQLEEKTGGKVIYNRGGVMFLFRGRNYNYRTRPRFPLMLWKPVPPVYPRLVQRVPEGLTLEEATELRKRGRKVPPICRLGKNGVYSNLVKDVKEAFEECELVRINCQGLHKSDCRKIGAKLKDLIPCILLSFECEHILMWRGRDWKCSLPPSEDSYKEAGQPALDGVVTASVTSNLLLEVHQGTPESLGTLKLLRAIESSNEDPHLERPSKSMALVKYDVNVGITEKCSPEGIHSQSVASPNAEPSMMHDSVANSVPKLLNDQEKADLDDVSSNEDLFLEGPSESMFQVKKEISLVKTDDLSEDMSSVRSSEVGNQLLISLAVQEDLSLVATKDIPHHEGNGQILADSFVLTRTEISCSGSTSENSVGTNALATLPTMDDSSCQKDFMSSDTSCLDGVMHLLRQAIENGSAIILDRESLDADIVLERAVSLAKTAPPGPVFGHKIRKVPVQKVENQNDNKLKKKVENQNDKKLEKKDLEVVEVVTIPEKSSEKKSRPRNRRRENFREGFLDVVPHGSLGVDELAKLLS